MLLGTWKDELVAVKVVRQECTQHVQAENREAYSCRAQKLQELKSQYIVKFHGACYDYKQVR